MLTYTDTKADHSYTINELKPSTRHFVTVRNKTPDGKGRNGSPHYALHSIEYFKTPAGEIELSLWLKLVEEASANEGKARLLDSIEKVVREDCVWLKSSEAIRLHAAECLCRESYKEWKEFKADE